MLSNKFFLITIYLTCSNAFVSDYVKGFTSYFGFTKDEQVSTSPDEFNNKVLYEVSTVDEKFISQAAKLTGVVPSELDKCQQRIILKLRKGCNELNDEDISKLAVMLLNCQSSIEGRRIYHCTNEMSIKDCTQSMDADTWNTYHLMSNRVRAVCYAARQTQFIGLTEHTINRLVDTARDQVKTLDKIMDDQEDLQRLAENTLESVKTGHDALASQQKDLERAQLYGQLLIENNLKRLADEKFLISQTHRELKKLTKSLENELELTASQLAEQTVESKINHKEILEDLMLIKTTAEGIFRSTEDFIILLAEQSEREHQRYVGTLKQLSEVNETVHFLVNLLKSTSEVLEGKLNWLSSVLGGTDDSLDRLYLLMWHIGFVIVTMILSSFIDLSISGRILVVALPCLNLAVGLQDLNTALHPLTLMITLISVLIGHTLMCFLYKKYHNEIASPQLSIKEPKSVDDVNSYKCEVKTTQNCDTTLNGDLYLSSNEDTFEEYCSPTPPLSRQGFYSPRSRSRTPSVMSSVNKNYCAARTRMGTPCKLFTFPGEEFCHRHMRGDSILR